MKVKITLLALLLGFCLPLSAQIYAEDYIIQKDIIAKSSRAQMIYGVMAGVTMPKLSDKQDALDISNATGFQLGMMWGVGLGALEIVPEIWYQHENTKLTEVCYDEKYSMVSNNIEVPILFVMRFADWFRFNIGPSFSLMNSTKIVADDDGDSIDFGRTRSAAGYTVGLSATLSERYIIDLRYTGRFVSADTEWHTGANSYEYRYYNMAFSVGYRF